MKKVAIGGQRLGSGNKMNVEMHGYSRSTHDLGYIWRSTMAPGTLVPFMTEVALPGDTFDIELDNDTKTHPTVGPLFGSYKVQMDLFQIPIRLYNSWLNNNRTKIGLKIGEIKLPQMALTVGAQDVDVDDNSQVNPSSIIAHLNMRGVGTSNAGPGVIVQREFNAVPFIGYWDIYKNYYANKQEEIGAVIETNLPGFVTITRNRLLFNNSGTPAFIDLPYIPGVFSGFLPGDTNIKLEVTYPVGPVPDARNTVFITDRGNFTEVQLFGEPLTTTGTTKTYGELKPEYAGIWLKSWAYYGEVESPPIPPRVETFPLTNIDDLRDQMLSTPGNTAFLMFSGRARPYGAVLGYQTNPSGITIGGMQQTQEGLAVKTYQSDMFNNWMQTTWIDGSTGINAITAVDTSSGEFTIDALNLANKIYNMMTRIALSGGTYDDWMETVYDVDVVKRATTPIYLGSLIKELVFQEVVSNSQAETAEGIQQLGTLAGRGVMSRKHKGGYITVKVAEPSYLMGIASITPRVDYSQGNKWDTNLKTMDDFHKPGLDAIGFQDLITDQMDWRDTQVPSINAPVFKSAGKQPAWMNYMTNVNITRGNFAIAENEMFMTLNRRYEYETGTGIKDLTTYIDPAKFNFIFAETAIDAQNFWVQIAVDITARRKMGAKVMPNL